MEKLKEMLYTSDLTSFDWVSLFTPKVDRKCVGETVYKSGEYSSTIYNEQGKPVKLTRVSSNTVDIAISEWEYQDNIVVERHGIQGQELTESVSVVRSDGLDYDGYFKYDEKGRIIENDCQTYEYGDDGKLKSISHKLADVSWDITYDDKNRISKIAQINSETKYAIMDVQIWHQEDSDLIERINCYEYSYYEDHTEYVCYELWAILISYTELDKVSCIEMTFSTNDDDNDIAYINHDYLYDECGNLLVDDYDIGSNKTFQRLSESYITIYHN